MRVDSSQNISKIYNGTVKFLENVSSKSNFVKYYKINA